MTIYRLNVIENVKRRMLIEELREALMPYSVEYDQIKKEYIIKVADKPYYSK